MEVKTFESSQIKTGWYNKETQTLTIQFPNGAKYDYWDVPEEAWTGLKAAESAGKYFNANIKYKFKFKRHE